MFGLVRFTDKRWHHVVKLLVILTYTVSYPAMSLLEYEDGSLRRCGVQSGRSYRRFRSVYCLRHQDGVPSVKLNKSTELKIPEDRFHARRCDDQKFLP
jgi:hypothetical protein